MNAALRCLTFALSGLLALSACSRPEATLAEPRSAPSAEPVMYPYPAELVHFEDVSNLPDAAAWKVALRTAAGELRSSSPPQRPVTLRPLRDPDGAVAPFLIQRQDDEHAAILGILHEGQLLTPFGGAEVAASWLRGIGFPARPLSRYLLAEALAWLGVLDRWYPLHGSWAEKDAWYTGAHFDEPVPAPILRIHHNVAELVLERWHEPSEAGAGGAVAPQHQRRTVRFEAGALKIEDEVLN